MLMLYRCLLFLYPAVYRNEFAEEMTSVFSEARQALRLGFAARISFCARETRGLLSGALREHLRNILGPEIPFRRLNMRAQFRFPRSTVFLMLVVFAGVILAIAQATSIQLKYRDAIGSVWPSLVSILCFMLLTMCAAAVIVLGVLHALRRTGAHRLANVRTWPEQK
jgi:hypothetical protein